MLHARFLQYSRELFSPFFPKSTGRVGGREEQRQRRRGCEYFIAALLCGCSNGWASLTLDRGTAAERRPDGAEEALHQGGDGPSADGEEPVQREADGVAGGGAVDGDDQVENAFRRILFSYANANANY